MTRKFNIRGLSLFIPALTLLLGCPSQPRGMLDASFGDGGRVSGESLRSEYTYDQSVGSTIVPDSVSDGFYVLGGSRPSPVPSRTDCTIWKYTSRGRPDRSFNGNGLKILTYIGYDGKGIFPWRGYAREGVVDSEGNLYITGWVISTNLEESQVRMIIWSLKPDGSSNTSFGLYGRLVGPLTTRADAIAIGGEGSLYLTGRRTGKSDESFMVVWKCDLFGELVRGPRGSDYFLESSSLTTGIEIEIDSQGRIVVMSYAGAWNSPDRQLVLQRYSPDGTVDPTFATAGSYSYSALHAGVKAYDMALSKSDYVYATGQHGTGNHFCIRLTPDGLLDPLWGNSGVVVFNDLLAEYIPLAITPNSAGGLYFTGMKFIDTDEMYSDSKCFLWSLGSDGTLDSDFGRNGIVEFWGRLRGGVTDAFGYDVVLTKNGRVLVAGKQGPMLEEAHLALWAFR